MSPGSQRLHTAIQQQCQLRHCQSFQVLLISCTNDKDQIAASSYRSHFGHPPQTMVEDKLGQGPPARRHTLRWRRLSIPPRPSSWRGGSNWSNQRVQPVRCLVPCTTVRCSRTTSSIRSNPLLLQRLIGTCISSRYGLTTARPCRHHLGNLLQFWWQIFCTHILKAASVPHCIGGKGASRVSLAMRA